MVRLEIPTDWTAADALVVVGFLDALATAIWQAYGLEMAEAIEAKADWEPPPFDDTQRF